MLQNPEKERQKKKDEKISSSTNLDYDLCAKKFQNL